MVPVLVPAVALVEVYGREAGAVPQEFSVAYPVYANGFSLADVLSIHHAEAVVLPEAEEIHRPGVDIGKVHNEFR